MKLNIFNRLLGARLRDQAIVAVEAGASPEWMAEASQAVDMVASRNHTFTTDDVWAVMTTSTPENRAMGAVMRRAQRDGVVTPTDEFRLTQRASSHRRPLRVWASVDLALRD